MKKQTILSIVLVFAVLFCMSIPTFADSQNVNGTYVPGANSQDVISADITWGAMNFTYTAASQGVWNPDTHKYDNAVAAKWEATGNTITVVNHSNVDVAVTFAFQSVNTISTITGSTFTYDDGTTENGVVILTAGTVNQVSTADKVIATLTLAGSLPSTHTAGAQIGTVTVTVAKAS